MNTNYGKKKHKKRSNRKTGNMLFFCLMLFTVISFAPNGIINNGRSSFGPQIYDDPDPKPSMIEILHSDVLYKRASDSRADILVGNVKLKHEGAYLD